MSKKRSLVKLVIFGAVCLSPLASCSKKTAPAGSSSSSVTEASSSSTVLPAYDMSGVAFPDVSAVYDGKEHKAEIKGTLPSGVTVSYRNNALTDAGKKTAVASFKGEDDHLPIPDMEAKLEVTKADVSGITFSDKTVTYDGQPHSLSIEGALPLGTTVSYDVSGKVNAGEYTVTATLSDPSGNYNGKTMTAKLTIEKADLDMTGISFSDKTITYDGLYHSLAIEGTLPCGITLTYQNNKYVFPGKYEVTASFQDPGSNYKTAPSEMKATLSIINAESDFSFTITDNKALITGYSGSSRTVMIPDTLNSCPVTGIGQNAFSHKQFTSIVLPDTVKSIGNGAFYVCSNLVSVSVPKNLETIDNNAFGLCWYLSSFDFPDTLTSIGSSAFKECKALTSVSIPDTVTSIGKEAFYNCEGLASLSLGSGLSSLGTGAFSYCPNLASLSVSAANTVYSSSGNCIFEKATKTLVLGSRISLIPSDGSITAIGAYAFEGTYGSSTLTIPDKVTTIGENAFAYCPNITSISFPSSLSTISKYAFWWCTGITSLSFPEGVASIGIGAFASCTNVQRLELSSTVSSLGNGAFAGCSLLDTITVAPVNTVYSSVDNTLMKGDTLVLGNKSGTFPSCSVKIVGEGAYSGYKDIKSITVPESVQIIGGSAFSWCSSLTSVAIGTNVVTIWDAAFSCCSSLTSIVLPEKATNLGTSVFVQCSKLKAIYSKLASKPSTWSAGFLGDCTASVYWYSETSNTDKSHWHYVNDTPTIWVA